MGRTTNPLGSHIGLCMQSCTQTPMSRGTRPFPAPRTPGCPRHRAMGRSTARWAAPRTPGCPQHRAMGRKHSAMGRPTNPLGSRIGLCMHWCAQTPMCRRHSKT
jgi:hypothetical protein